MTNTFFKKPWQVQKCGCITWIYRQNSRNVLTKNLSHETKIVVLWRKPLVMVFRDAKVILLIEFCRERNYSINRTIRKCIGREKIKELKLSNNQKRSWHCNLKVMVLYDSAKIRIAYHVQKVINDWFSLDIKHSFCDQQLPPKEYYFFLILKTKKHGRMALLYMNVWKWRRISERFFLVPNDSNSFVFHGKADNIKIFLKGMTFFIGADSVKGFLLYFLLFFYPWFYILS